MVETLKSLIFTGFLISLGYTVYYSVKFRREQKPNQRGLLQAKQNISMGILLILLAGYPLFVTSGSIGVVIGALFILIGVFNLFAGIRNQSTYRARLK